MPQRTGSTEQASEKPRRFKIVLLNEKNKNEERWGCYFPNSDLSVNDQGIVSQGKPICGELVGQECVTWVDLE